MSAEIWRHLGIAETDDETEVRRAYAERLKQTNPEDDPEGFKRLRNAYERALQNIRWRARYEAHEAEDAAADAGEAAPNVFGSPLEGELAVEPAQPAKEPDPVLETHYAARAKLAEALRGHASPWEVQAAFQALVNDPGMERLGVFVSTETWLANLLRMHGGDGAALLDAAIKHFRWDDRASALKGGVGPGMVAYRETLEQEGKARAFLLRVQDKRHEFHAAYKEVTRPLSERGWFARVLAFSRFGLVDRFLEYVYDKTPYAEDEFDFDAVDFWRRRIAFWRRPLEWIGWAFWIALVAGVIALFVLMAPPSDPADETDVFSLRTRCVVQFALPTSDGSACDAYLQQAPGSLLMRQYAGIIALRQGQAAEARAHFERVLEVSPADATARYGLGMALLRETDRATQERALLLLREAMAMDDTVSIFFAENGVPSIPALEPVTLTPVLPEPTFPQADTAPRDLRIAGQQVFQDAYAHFGIRSQDQFDSGRVTVRCLARATGALTECLILEETPRNGGRGEVALWVLAHAQITPAQLDGVTVDGFPVRAPVVFELEGQ